MSKIGSDHLARSAIVYVRQSSAFQVAQNLESQRRQYALVARAQELGWSEVEVIDMISVGPEPEAVVPASKNSSRRFAKGASVPCYPWRRRG